MKAIESRAPHAHPFWVRWAWDTVGRKRGFPRLEGMDGPMLTAIDMSKVLRLAVSRAEAAAALGMSLDSFERYVQAEVRLIRRGRMRLVPVSELRRWLAENSERPMAELRGG